MFKAIQPILRAFVFGLVALSVVLGPAGAQVDDYRDIEFPELQEFVIERPEMYELDNGMKVFLMEDHELPLIQAFARIRTGSAWEPSDKVGLAGLAGSVQRTGGTRDLPGDQMDDFLEARAASIETSISSAVGFASMDCLKDDFDDVFGLFHDVLRHPAFEESKLEIAKAQTSSGIARRNDNVLGITSREFSRLVYGADSPLSRLAEYATIDAVSRQDLIDWHAKYYHPNNILLGVVGDFDSSAMKKKIAATFGGWPRGPEFEGAEIDYKREMQPGVFFIEKEDVTQANVRVGHLGTTMDDPDYFPLQIMNEVLSGGFSGRLLRNIRSEKGLAYSAFGAVGASFAYPGVAAFGLQTKSETMAEAVDALYEELEGMISNPATEAEIGRARDTILNSFIFNYVSKGQILGQQMLYDYYGMPVDFLETYRDRIEQVTSADVARVAEEYLHPDKATLLVVGRASDFDRPVSTFGDVTVLDISIPDPPDETAATGEISEADMAAGREIFDSMVAALGGSDPGSLEAVRVKTQLDINMQGQKTQLAQTLLVVFPDRLHTVVETPMGTQEVVVSGGEGFVRVGGQVQPLPPDRVERQVKDLGRELLSLLRNQGAEGMTAALVGEEDVDGEPARTIVLSAPSFTTRLWIDGGGRVLKQTYQGRHPFTGAPGAFEVRYSDYKEVSGMLLPHARVTTIDGAEFSTGTSDSIEINPPVDPMIFEKPAA